MPAQLMRPEVLLLFVFVLWGIAGKPPADGLHRDLAAIAAAGLDIQPLGQLEPASDLLRRPSATAGRKPGRVCGVKAKQTERVGRQLVGAPDG
jgi:hypothetical protein